MKNAKVFARELTEEEKAEQAAAANVKGGAKWRGTKLGRVARFYWSTAGEPIVYVLNGNKVPRTDGARPLMCLDDRVPDDLDRARYVAEAKKLARDLAVPLPEDL